MAKRKLSFVPRRRSHSYDKRFQLSECNLSAYSIMMNAKISLKRSIRYKSIIEARGARVIGPRGARVIGPRGGDGPVPPFDND